MLSPPLIYLFPLQNYTRLVLKAPAILMGILLLLLLIVDIERGSAAHKKKPFKAAIYHQNRTESPLLSWPRLISCEQLMANVPLRSFVDAIGQKRSKRYVHWATSEWPALEQFAKKKTETSSDKSRISFDDIFSLRLGNGQKNILEKGNKKWALGFPTIAQCEKKNENENMCAKSNISRPKSINIANTKECLFVPKHSGYTEIM